MAAKKVARKQAKTAANRTPANGKRLKAATGAARAAKLSTSKKGASAPPPKKDTATKHEQATGQAASRLIDQRISDLAGWRGETLARMRALILDSDPEMTEEWKWMGTPIWSHHGIVCTGEAYAKVVKHTFARGASLADPSHLFNSSMDGNTRRAIDIHEGEQVDANAFKALIKAAVLENSRRVKR